MKNLKRKTSIYFLIFLFVITSSPFNFLLNKDNPNKTYAQYNNTESIIRDFIRLNNLEVIPPGQKDLLLTGFRFENVPTNSSSTIYVSLRNLGVTGDPNTTYLVDRNIIRYNLNQTVQQNDAVGIEEPPLINYEELKEFVLSNENIDKLKISEGIWNVRSEEDLENNQTGNRDINLNQNQQSLNTIIRGIRNLSKIQGEENISKIAEDLSNDGEARVIIKLNTGIQSVYPTILPAIRKTKSQLQQEFSDNKNRVSGIASEVKNIIRIGGGEVKLDERNFYLTGGLIVAEVNQNTLNNLNNSNKVEAIYHDYKVKVFLDESISQIGANLVWNQGDRESTPLRGFGKKIAIIDTGVDYTHPFLGGCFGSNCKVYGGWDFANNDGDPMDDHYHGTHVAGIAAGKDPNNVYNGVAPEAKILAVKVLNANGSGFHSNVLAGINYAVDPNRDGDFSDRVDVINLSLGADVPPDPETERVITQAVDRGVVVVAAAGNSGPLGKVGSPANSRDAIAVAASCKTIDIGNNNRCSKPIANFSSRGPIYNNGVNYFKPDVAAPGVRIMSSLPGNRRAALNGTSMASPHIAGVVAILRQAFPDLTAREIKEMVKNSARNLDSDGRYGLTYDDQGSGEFDFRLAPVFGLGFLRFDPLPYIQIISDPTQRYTNRDFQFRIRGLNYSGLVFVRASSVPGVNINFQNDRFNLNNNQTVNFDFSVRLDNDSLPLSGDKILTRIQFLDETGRILGNIHLDINLRRQIEINPEVIDYGVSPGSLNNWTSEWITLTIVNKRRDRSFTFNINPQQPSGVSLDFSNTSFNLPPGGSVNLNSRALTNSNAQRGELNGRLLFLSTDGRNVSIPTKLFKGYVLDITTSDQPEQSLNSLMIHTNSLLIVRSFNPNENIRVYLPIDGHFDIILNNFKDSYYPGLALVDTENVIIPKSIYISGGNPIYSIHFNNREANRKVTYKYFNENNERILSFLHQNLIYFKTWQPENRYFHADFRYHAIGIGVSYKFRDTIRYPSHLDRRYNTLEFLSSPTIQPASKFYVFYDNILTNQLENINFGGSSRFKTVDYLLTRKFNDNRNETLPPIFDIRITKNFGGWRSALFIFISRTRVPFPFTTRVYYDLNGNSGDLISVFNRSTLARTPYNLYFSPVTYLDSNKRSNLRYVTYYELGRLIPDEFRVEKAEQNKNYVNLGPVYFSGKLLNEFNRINLYPRLYFQQNLNPGIVNYRPIYLTLSSLLNSQDFSAVSYPPVPIKIYINNVLYLTTQTPPFESIHQLMHTGIYERGEGRFAPIAKIDISDGLRRYDIKMDIGPFEWNWSENEFNLRSWATFIFNLLRNDRNPPAMKALRLYNNNQFSEYYHPDKENKIRAIFDPIDGQISNIKLSYFYENQSPIELANVNNTDTIEAIIPNNIRSQLITLIFEATDDSNNKLINKIEIPNINNIVSDSQPPTVRIISPEDNQSLSGIVNITAEAEDNIGISNVKFYINHEHKHTKYQPPYQVSIDTLRYPNGTYTISVEAEDLYNNKSTSSVNVSFANMIFRLLEILPEPNSVISGVVQLNLFLGGDINGRVSLVFKDIQSDSTITLTSTSTLNPFVFYWDTTNINSATYYLREISISRDRRYARMGEFRNVRYIINNNYTLSIESPLNNSQYLTDNDIFFKAVTSQGSNFSARIINTTNNTQVNSFNCSNTTNCSQQYNNIPVGNYRFEVIATSTDGRFSEVRSVNFSVVQPEYLNLRISSPTNNTQYFTGENIIFSAETTRAANFSARIINTTNNTQVNSFNCSNTTNCSQQYNNIPVGNYRFEVIATSTDGRFSEVRSVNFSVVQYRLGLNLRISSPPNNTQYSTGENIIFSAETTRAANFSARIINTTNNTQVNSFNCSNTTNCSQQYNNIPVGNYRFEVIATSTDGRVSAVRSVNFSVVQPEYLNLRISSPTNNTQYFTGENIIFIAETTRAANFSARIINTTNNTQVNSFNCSNTTNCSQQYNNIPVGNYRFEVIATSTDGRFSETRSVNFSVQSGETISERRAPRNLRVNLVSRDNNRIILNFSWERPVDVTNPDIVEFHLNYCTMRNASQNCVPRTTRAVYRTSIENILRRDTDTFSWQLDFTVYGPPIKRFQLVANYSDGSRFGSNIVDVDISNLGRNIFDNNMLANILLLLHFLLNQK